MKILFKLLVILAVKPFLVVAADQYFSLDTYSSIMRYIKKESEMVHDSLLQCANAIKKPCIIKVDTVDMQGVFYPQGEFKGYAFLKLPDMREWSSEIVQKNLKYLVDIYATYIAIYGYVMPLAGRKYMLNLIKVLNLDLYEIFKSEDYASGVNHLRLKSLDDSLAAVSYNPIDGLPLIVVDKRFVELSLGQQLFTIAHELAHYVLEHLMFADNIGLPRWEVAGFGRLSLAKDQNLFKKAKRRINEYEADRFAILEFGTKIEDAVSLFNKQKAETESLSTFLHASHPDINKRLEYLLSLEQEIGRKKSPYIIDWNKLAQDYRDFGWS